jgi:hypothetical protein
MSDINVDKPHSFITLSLDSIVDVVANSHQLCTLIPEAFNTCDIPTRCCIACIQPPWEFADECETCAPRIAHPSAHISIFTENVNFTYYRPTASTNGAKDDVPIQRNESQVAMEISTGAAQASWTRRKPLRLFPYLR